MKCFDLLPMPILIILILSNRVFDRVNAWIVYPNALKTAAVSSRSCFHTSGAKANLMMRGRFSIAPLQSSTKYENIISNSTHEEFVSRSKRRDESPTSEFEMYQSQKIDLHLVLIDNYDSYTYNIFSYLSTLCKDPPKVISNDAYDSWDDLIQDVGKVDGIVISPGPGRPEKKEDIGICLEAIRKNPDLPILGICLGHQALGYHYGARVDLSPFGPVHGLSSRVWHAPLHGFDYHGDERLPKCELFKGIPQSFEVIRYHSLVVEFPDETDQNDVSIEPIAWCRSDTEAENGDGEICMALRHKVNPHYGVQFHPESIGTGEYGYKILENFCKFCVDRNYGLKCINGNISSQKENDVGDDFVKNDEKPNASKYKVCVHKIRKTDQDLPSPEVVFENLFASMNDSFWLDSSTGRKDADIDEMKKPSAFGKIEGCPIVSNSRFSIMGGIDGPLSKKVEYWGKDHKVESRGLFVTKQGGFRERAEDSRDIVSFLRDEIIQNGVNDLITEIKFDATKNVVEETTRKMSESVPFNFSGGFVGFLGYEVRHETRNAICNQESCGVAINDKEPSDSSNPMVPTAAFLFVDRSLVYDHWRDEWYLVGIFEDSGCSMTVVDWMRNTSLKINSLSKSKTEECKKSPSFGKGMDLPFNLKRSKEEYSLDIERCHMEIRNGESYELCLTNQLSTRVSFPARVDPKDSSPAPFGLYKILRSRNPAPFAAFLNFYGDTAQKESSVSICCSSPERFLSMTKQKNILPDLFDETVELGHGWGFAPPFVSKNDDNTSRFIVESKPIKGTAKRIIAHEDDLDFHNKQLEDKKVAEELQRSGKNRAENLMIVDLLRNDLSRVCEPGSVHVPKLMGIESFATVHQMVSTIRGVVEDNCTPIDVIAASFPGGSMTGAPKLRSVDILDELELGSSRGPYSGCLGYISLNGSMDMNIIIRTAVVTPSNVVDTNEILSWDVMIGAGGAITALSESADEFDEMLLKANAIKRSVQQWHADGQEKVK